MATTPDELYAYLGAYVWELRKKRGMTRKALGDAVFLTDSSIRNFESGRQKVPFHTVLLMCAALNEPAADVVAAVVRDNDIRPYES